MDVRDTLLLVDDMGSSRAILRGIFEDNYNLLEAENGEQALLLLEQNHHCIAAMLLDVMMPVKTGYEVLEEMGQQGLLAEIPVIIITAEGSVEGEVRAFDLGAADIIVKPYDHFVVRHRVDNIVELFRHKWHLEELVEEQAEILRHSNEVMVDALSALIEYRSVESGQHILRIRRFTKILLEDIARSFPEYRLTKRTIGIIASAAALHDIGKISIPDSILNKPGKLTKEEFEIMKGHSLTGCRMLESLAGMGNEEYLCYAHNICRYHHERWDGKGYPEGLKGDNIPICAQVVGLADAYDALTTQRVYKDAYPCDRAMNMILNGECGAFSPKLLECFKNVCDDFASLAHAYADGLSPNTEAIPAPMPRIRHKTLELDTQQMAQLKYHTILHYVDATVVEVDLDRGIYHLVYNPDPDLILLQASNTFEEGIRTLILKMVHPEDRAQVLELLTTYLQGFLDDGLRKQTRRYRMHSNSINDYRWYDCTILRVDVGDSSQHKLLITWRKVDDEEVNGTVNLTTIPDEAFHAGLLGAIYRCRNDQWFTLTEPSKGLQSLLGYSDKEIFVHFKDRLIDLICQEDRKAVRASVSEQLSRGRHVELEFRMCRKDGSFVWVLEKCHLTVGEDGREYLYGVLMDISHTKKAQEALHLTLERHQIIMNQTDDIIFEWDIVADTVSYSTKWETLFGYTPIKEHMMLQVPKASHIHPEDIPVFLEKVRTLQSKGGYQEAEVRIAKADSRYLWCRIRGTAQCDEEGKPVKVVGVIINIDGEKRANQDLKTKAERDALTKLLNKNAARCQIEDYLSSCQMHDYSALIIIDLDNFKQVNDCYGHMFGDAVLTQVAREIRRLFRSEDILARIGGDEFMVFIKNIPNRSLLGNRCARLVATVHDMFRTSLPGSALSCSVGAAIFPDHATAFQELFQRADQALYRAKGQGKNRYVCYNSRDCAVPAAQGDSTVRERIDSDERPGLADNSMVHYAFHRLYESGDVEDTVNDILAMIGRQMNVSRVYIFENSLDNKWCSNTFEWCNEGITEEKENLQNISYETDIPNYENNFDERGIFYCQDITLLPKHVYDIMEPQGIKSVLQCTIRDNGKFRGYVGFDECAINRLWTQEQIDMLSFLSEMLSVFLLKKRAQDETANRVKDLYSVLDNQNTWIYVIDPDTCEMKFLNAKTLAWSPEAAVGMHCYTAIGKQNKRCKGCPALGIQNAKNCTRVMENKLLGLRVRAEASMVSWGGKEACLIVCHELTNPEQG